MSCVLASGLTGFMSPFRPSQGWGDCGGSCTPFGSTSGVYMPECTSSSGLPAHLAKLQRMSMNQEERWTHRQRRGRKRRCPDSHPGVSIPLRPFRITVVDIYFHALRSAGPNCFSLNIYALYLAGKTKISLYVCQQGFAVLLAVHLSHYCSKTC